MSFPPKQPPRKTSYTPPQQNEKSQRPKEPPHHPLLRLTGQDIIIKQRNGMEVKGKLIDYKEGLLKISGATLLFTKDGRNLIVSVEWVMVDRSAVAMIVPLAGDEWLAP